MDDEWRRPIVSELQFNVAQLLKEATGATRTFDIRTRTVGQLAEEVTVVSPLVGSVKLLRTGSDILVTGSLQATVQKGCGRCLTLFAAPISIELEEQFHPTIDIIVGKPVALPDDADEANRIDEQHILDLNEVVRQAMLLESDSILYCRPDCKGLCPHCGQDRNLEPCTCEEEMIDPRWAGLEALHTED